MAADEADDLTPAYEPPKVTTRDVRPFVVAGIAFAIAFTSVLIIAVFKVAASEEPSPQPQGEKP